MARKGVEGRVGVGGRLAGALLLVGGVAVSWAGGIDVAEHSVRFAIENVNRSRAQYPGCTPDELAYEVVGDLVAPASALTGANGGALTIYLHSASAAGDAIWRQSAVPGYDWAAEMATLGHAALVIDMLGWGRSDHPPGNAVCLAAEADILHQVIDDLRHGDYSIESGSPVPFTTISVATFSGAAIVAQIEAYSWRDDVDGLILMGYSDPPTGLAFVGVLPGIFTTCARGGENLNDDGTGPPGYVYAWPSPEAEARDLTYNMDPAVREALKASIIRDPCGGILSGGGGILADFVNVPSLRLPVLLVYGDHDAMAPARGALIQEALYSGNPDLTTVLMPETGHAMMIERTAPVLRGIVDEWLNARAL